MAAIANLIHLGLSRLPTPSNTQAALDRAKESADADVLTDITVDFGASYYVLFSNNCVRVRGKGVPRAPSTSAATATPVATTTPAATTPKR